MYVKPNTKNTNLRTTDTNFEVVDMRSVPGWPEGQGGLLFEHREMRTIQCKYTGSPIKRYAHYLVRTAAGEEGWRIDLLPRIGPTETVYGLDRATHWATNHEAASALQGRLDEIRDNSSLGS